MSRGTKIGLILIWLAVISIFIPRDIFGSEMSSQYELLIRDLSIYHDVPSSIAIAVATVESNIEMIISSPNSNGTYDIGIFQLNSAYISYFEDRLWDNPWDFNPEEIYDNIEMGVLILKDLAVRTGSWDSAVKAYHVGPSGLHKYPDLADQYFNKVINLVIVD